MRLAAVAIASALLTAPGLAQSRSEFRAIWVDTFNTPLNSHADVLKVVANAHAMKANAVLAQVRRRGDAWYLDALEPPPDRVPIDAGFDPLRDLIQTSHILGIEVHAFVIASAVWNGNPSTAIGRPSNPRHVFNRHGGYDADSRTIVPGPDNWLTRTLVADGVGDVSYQGHRIGSDFWIDPGHPSAAAYTVDVLTHLVRQYDLDGLHLDRIRYPEISVPGQTPLTGASIGYNAASVARFQRRHGIAAGSPPPEPSDSRWADWRRGQVTELVRRIYLNAVALKPRLTVSAAVIAFGAAPAGDAGWRSAEAYWRVYQDWRAWLEEGILDLAIPMIYRREHDRTQAAQFDQWLDWFLPRRYGRFVITGQGAFVNSVEGTLAQTRRAVAPRAGQAASGVAFFSLATPTSAVNANPLSQPPGQNTPVRSVDELASALTTGRSRDGRTLYESAAAYPPVFADAAFVPAMPWKIAPKAGHIMGTVADADGHPIDGAAIRVLNWATGEQRTVTSDGGGFYGFVDLAAGRYVVRGVADGESLTAAAASVSAGRVTTVNLSTREATCRRCVRD